VKENPNGQPTDLYSIDQFTYVPEENCYICPEGIQFGRGPGMTPIPSLFIQALGANGSDMLGK